MEKAATNVSANAMRLNMTTSWGCVVSQLRLGSAFVGKVVQRSCQDGEKLTECRAKLPASANRIESRLAVVSHASVA
jgi:hypothetical protein